MTDADFDTDYMDYDTTEIRVIRARIRGSHCSLLITHYERRCFLCEFFHRKQALSSL